MKHLTLESQLGNVSHKYFPRRHRIHKARAEWRSCARSLRGEVVEAIDLKPYAPTQVYGLVR